MRYLLCALALCGCVNPLANLRASRELTVGAARFELRYAEPDQGDQERVAASLSRAAPQLERWKGLAASVTLNLVPDHDALEAAVHRGGWGWLRAWARYDDVILQAPSTWLPTTGREQELDELLTHELTHCLLFQRSATKDTWTRRQIPLWFREGMATNTARQAARFPSLEDLARWLAQNPDRDVFTDGEALARDFYEPVYGLAHHAIAFLLKRYGDGALTATLDAMAGGAAFPDAFKTATGLTTSSFERDFLNFVRWRGFRGAGLPIKKREWLQQIQDLRTR